MKGGWETGTGYRREKRKGKGGREGEERGVPQLQLLHPSQEVTGFEGASVLLAVKSYGG